MLDYAAFPKQRQDLIRKILRDQGRVVCIELAQQMGVSEHTVRRDLHELSKEGVCKKVYGGAVLQLPDAGTLDSRKGQNLSAKSTIAQRCASLITSENCIFIDAGSTNLAMAKSLPDELTITVVTNAPDIAAALLKHPNIEVIMLGGRIQKDSGGSVGNTAIEQLRNIMFDQAFMGGCAMSPEAGLTGFNFDDCEFKKAAIAQSSQVIVGLTSEKIPGVARFSVASCEDIDILVVEENLDKNFHSSFLAENITILTV
ncbi:DeoR/GlpR family DNA-binding transcription regulator [Pantoea sp. MQR6]|uniref:DeoR/GlpR family DNA-binding transcription regulator n=1 Tax=Pantoea sp. MQR6 TaxID=2907307 RepID=UPI001FAABD87|nr:DeoR/GlpR family DNA-binding transcription regulator [Pantoea sp. MQR6]